MQLRVDPIVTALVLLLMWLVIHDPDVIRWPNDDQKSVQQEVGEHRIRTTGGT